MGEGREEGGGAAVETPAVSPDRKRMEFLPVQLWPCDSIKPAVFRIPDVQQIAGLHSDPRFMLVCLPNRKPSIGRRLR